MPPKLSPVNAFGIPNAIYATSTGKVGRDDKATPADSGAFKGKLRVIMVTNDKFNESSRN